MTEKEQKKIDDVIHYFNESESFYRVKKIREVLNINPLFDKNREIEIIEYLYRCVLQNRKKIKSTLVFSSTSGWTVTYYRNKKEYKEDEDFELEVHHSFVDYDTNE